MQDRKARTRSGRQWVPGVELANRESGASWRGLVLRSNSGVWRGGEFVVSEDHAALKLAILELLTEAAWQRCDVHFPHNA
ncbi:MAG: transposase, partial [Acidobacteriota bacterium]|nr:transposase [Acidobacteriota bacterium]